MARARNPNRDKAFEIYKEYNGDISLVEIASQLNTPDGTIRGWKSKDSWDDKLNGTLQTNNTERSKRKKRKKGGQPGNKNAVGNSGGSAPEENKNAERHGFFSKWLPEETAEIMGKIQSSDPLDLLWDNIQLQYTAIIRAQKLMYVKDQEDKTEEEGVIGADSTVYNIQQAWDKHATFMNAQSRAMKTLESMIKQYDELLHKNWELASEEQKARIALLKSKVNAENENKPCAESDDGFLEALEGKVDEVWQEE